VTARQAGSDPVIEAEGLTRRFGDFVAVDALDLEVERGTIYGFLGPNGSGKTTTVRMLIGLLTPSAGSIKVLGRRLQRDSEWLRRHIGYMTQHFSLYDDLSVRENLSFVARVYGLHHGQARERIRSLVHVHGLGHIARRRAGTMSGGERQRLALAAATLHEPQLLFLDEPTSAVDPQSRRDFWDRLFDLVDAGTTILVSTHYMDEAERCHRLAILQAGRKRADGTPDQLMANMDANAVEIEATDQRRLRQQLLRLPEVISATQLGSRLRVLVHASIQDPVAWLRAQPTAKGLIAIEAVRPNLEDVFVTSTHAEHRP
jgi:ABC-2 type transport system ATP-binding protein